MPFPFTDPSSSKYSLVVGHGGDITLDGSTIIDLHDYGFRVADPFNFTNKYAEAPLGEADGSLPVWDKKMAGEIINLVGQPYDTNAHTTTKLYLDMLQKLNVMNTALNPYLELALFDSSLKPYRRYAEFVNARAVYHPHTAHGVFASMSLAFRAFEGVIYYGDRNNMVITLAAGTGSAVAAWIEGNGASKRCLFKIICDGNTLTNITVDNGRGGTWTWTGSLTTATHYLKVDHYRGLVLLATGSGEVDDSVNFAGTFFEIEDGDTVTVNTSVGTTATSVRMAVLPRMA